VRYDFYEDGEARALATFASDRLQVALERYHRDRMFGTLTVTVEVKAGNPFHVVVTPEESVKGANLRTDDA